MHASRVSVWGVGCGVKKMHTKAVATALLAASAAVAAAFSVALATAAAAAAAESVVGAD